MDSRWFQLGEHRVHVRCWESAVDAPVVLLVHGLLVSSRYMIPLANELCSSGCNVYAIDLPGHGRSARPSRPLDIEQLGGVLVEFLEVAGLADVTIVANSFGSQVTTEAARVSTERIRQLVLVGSTVDAGNPGMLRHALMMAACLPFEPWWFLPVALRDFFGSGVRTSALALWRMSRHPMLERAKDIAVPVSVVRGRYDFVSNDRWIRSLARATMAGDVFTIERAGHIVHGKRPDVVARYVMREIDAVSSVGHETASLAESGVSGQF